MITTGLNQISSTLPLVQLAGTIEEHTLSDGIQLTIVGMLVVFIALLAILGLLTALKKICSPNRSADMTPAAESKSGQGSPAVTSPVEGIDPQIMAAIIASVAVAVGQPARIRSVRLIRNEPGSAWSGRGRTSIQSSHRMRKGIK
ncbi:MAG: OadG family protein [Candidatus Sumerlaeia bacterium]|nr:OadG family protein [Candidatus Sumerlaeia bacterium]